MTDWLWLTGSVAAGLLLGALVLVLLGVTFVIACARWWDW